MARRAAGSRKRNGTEAIPYVRLQAGAIGEVEVLSRERARSR